MWIHTYHYLANCFIIFAFPLSAFIVIISVLSSVLVIKYLDVSISALSTECVVFVFVLFWHSVYPQKFPFSFYSFFSLCPLLCYVIKFMFSLHSSRAPIICVNFFKKWSIIHIQERAYKFNLFWQMYTAEWPFLLSRYCLFILFQKIPSTASQSFFPGNNDLTGFSLSVMFLRFIQIVTHIVNGLFLTAE